MVIRTYYVKGLLFYIGNPLRSAFLAVQLVDDQVSVTYSPDMQAVDAINSSAHISDGAWHTVSQSTFHISQSINKLKTGYFQVCVRNR